MVQGGNHAQAGGILLVFLGKTPISDNLQFLICLSCKVTQSVATGCYLASWPDEDNLLQSSSNSPFTATSPPGQRHRPPPSPSAYSIEPDMLFFGISTCSIPPVWQRSKADPKWHSAADQTSARSLGGCCCLHVLIFISVVKGHRWKVAVPLRCSYSPGADTARRACCSPPCCQMWQQAIPSPILCLPPSLAVSHSLHTAFRPAQEANQEEQKQTACSLG